MKPPSPAPLRFRARRRAGAVGFTLVELMVAVTGGLFVSIMLFVLARDGSRFYQREARMADATLAAMVGFERLRNDIARAGFLGTPNIDRDPRVCRPPPLTGELGDLASLRIEPDLPTPNAVLSDNQRSPDTIVLGGAYSSVDQFPLLGVIDNGGSGYSVDLQRSLGASARVGLSGQDDQTDLEILQPYFQAGRGLRIVDQTGKFHFGYISGLAVSAGVPTITLSATTSLPVRAAGKAGPCSLTDVHTMGTVNVLNFVRYSVRDLRGDPRYAPVYAEPDPRGWDVGRTELVRDELLASDDNTAIAGSEEIVAEYAVDLDFEVTVVDGRDPNGNPVTVRRITGQALAGEMGRVSGNAAAIPHLARMVRVRLSVRSREADRQTPIVPGPGVAPGFYRMGLGPNGGAPFARVRTLQADIALHNQVGLTWW